jgi:endogenous inhibitor of DNA gyrase (YacG/DUF329 family)
MKLTCEECGAPFESARTWQRFCSSHCQVMAQNRRLNEKAKQKRKQRAQQVSTYSSEWYNQPLAEYERQLSHDGVYRLCAALFESAYKERDREFFGTDMAKLICDSVGVDPQWALMKAWEA